VLDALAAAAHASVAHATKHPSNGNRAAYDTFIGLHVACALVGFGAVALSGAYGGHARHLDSSDLGRPAAFEELRRYFRARGLPELLIVVVPIFGALAVAVGPSINSFSQAWIGIGLTLWVVATILLLGVVRPSEAVLRRTVAGEKAEDAEALSDGDALAARRAGIRLQWATGATDLIFLVALVVMVTKPGS
jgi:uncharacterized membrane protein